MRPFFLEFYTNLLSKLLISVLHPERASNIFQMNKFCGSKFVFQNNYVIGHFLLGFGVTRS